MVLGALAGLIINLFLPAILMASVWFSVVGAYLSAHRPEPGMEVVPLLGMVADIHLIGFLLPTLILGIVGVLLLVALL